MSDLAASKRPISRRMQSAASWTSITSWISVLCVFTGLMLPEENLSYLMVGFGGGLAVMVLIYWALAARLGLRRETSALENLIQHDERPLFLVDRSGAVRVRNAAARSAYSATTTESFEKILEAICPQANAVIFRLQAKAERLNAAREDVVSRAGRYAVSAHKVGKAEYLWAIEDISDRSAPQKAPEKISLPMLTTAASGSILSMNDAMRALLAGRKETTIQKLFTEMPEKSGDLVSLPTEGGTLRRRAIIMPSSSGRREYFLAPFDPEDAATTSLDVLEEFPVALLKVSSDGIVLEANKLARKLVRIDANGNERLSDLLDGLGRPITDWLADAAEGRSLHKPEVLKAKNGDAETYLQITLGRVIRDGEVSLLAMLSDATELKSLEAQFVQSQKMQAIGQLAGGVAHDFNNLLTAISGHCDLLMLRHDPGDPEYGDLEQINQNANRAASLVGQLLAFSRKQNLQLEVLDMRDTLADLTHLLNRLVGAQITLSLIHDPQLLSVRADRRQLEQVIMNLVVNARDAMDGRGEISIETRNLKLNSDLSRDRAVVPRGEYVVVKVSDTGRGIPPDKMAKIFEPFFTTKRTGEGTGLGLSTAYGIVKQSGGFIFADSVVEQGTVFSIFFPTSELPVLVEPIAPKKAIRLDPVLEEGVVLLVEDEAPVRAFASRALKLRGYNVLEAECAEEALDLLADPDLNVDVVVTDVVMPGMDGPTWVKEARKARPDMRVVFVSGYAEDSIAENQAALPNTVFLPKPFSLSDLTSTVQSQMADAA